VKKEILSRGRTPTPRAEAYEEDKFDKKEKAKKAEEECKEMMDMTKDEGGDEEGDASRSRRLKIIEQGSCLPTDFSAR
jgi:hypothetical protein